MSICTETSSLLQIPTCRLTIAVKQLTPLSGNKFDEIYAAMMVQDHQNAIMLFERASRSSDKDIKAFADKHLPALRSHLSQITEISRATSVK